MPDVVVTVPKTFGLREWIAEGDAAGAPWSGQEWHFYLYGRLPDIARGERVYVVYNGKLRGYSPLWRIERMHNVGGNAKFFGSFALVRRGEAQAVTVPETIIGFRGWRYRWWDRQIEVPFPEWRMP